MRIASVASAVCLASAVLASGCTLYFGDDDDKTCPAIYPEGDGRDIAYVEYRDPYTGECYSAGGGGGGCWYNEDCDYICYDYDLGGGERPPSPTMPQDDRGGGGTAGDQPDATPPIQTGALCYSHCDGLSDSACRDTEGCQLAYETTYGPSGTVSYERLGCWATDNYVPTSSGSCGALDAYACSGRDDCTMNYDSTGLYPYKTGPDDEPVAPPRSFSYCGSEGGSTCASTDCGPGYTCVDSCYETTMDPSSGMDTACVATCIPVGSGCEAIDCAPGYECVDTCAMGANGGLWCNPTCTPVTACETLTTKQACDARGDCTSVYDGENCTCYENGYCECETLTWARCES